MQYINATELSPLISKCQVKVCYVGQEPNRNGTVITKKVATEMGKKLPGSPVVGYYNKKNKDFEQHNREIEIDQGKFEIIDTTKAYGFVPPEAKVWFQKFDDEGVEREYLVTECYIWTGVYPESNRIMEQGNNQSMELNNEKTNGFWANDDNSGKRFFIYNEALIEKLCILGEDVEPCFEGAQFRTEFSLENNAEFQKFKNTMFSILSDLQETFKKGGSQGTMQNEKKIENTPIIEEFKKKPEEENPADKEKEKENTPPAENACGGGSGDEKKKKKNYNLEEVTEYAELQEQYNTLQSQYSALQQEKATLDTEIAALKEFKLQAERQSKQTMIDSFYMLTDEDKKDVIDNMDTYSLDDIEAKLSVICVRNKVNFNLNKQDEGEEHKEETPAGLFNLKDNNEDGNVPAWIQAVRANNNI